MTKNLSSSKIALVIFGVVALIYGVLFLFVPDVLVNASGGDPVPSGWLRWPGGILVALGMGSLLISGNPAKQEIFVFTLALGSLLCGLALLYALFFERVTEAWFSATPAIINLIVSALLWVGWKNIKSNKEGTSVQ